MSSSNPSAKSRDFLAVARELAFLSSQTLDDLAREATSKQTTPLHLALQKGLLKPAQVDVIDTLLRATEVVPGYEILSVLGQGGMGVVYRARQLNLKRIVALKTVLVNQMDKRTMIERFHQEAHAVARLAHPHIVTAYDFGQHEGRLYFAMELVTGEDLAKRLRRQGLLDERTVWGIVRQAAAGLTHAAQRGIVHRDIKPANLLLVEPPAGFPLAAGLPMVKITDFGLAQLASAAEERTRLTSANVTVGSPNYMSPEHLRGDVVDLRSDIFALGATAFHMLAGRPPQAGKALSQIVAQRIGGEVESVRELRPEVSEPSAQLVAAMMAPDLTRRLPSYEELIRRIDRLELPPSESSIPTVPSPAALTARNRWTEKLSRLPKPKWMTLGSAALAIALVLAGLSVRGPSVGNRDLVPSGRIEELFNGQNISQWKPVTGGWSQAKNEEGAIVLQGSGLVRRSILRRNDEGDPRPPEHYRLMLAVDPHEAASVEVQFDLAGPGVDDRFVFLRIDRQGCTLGSRASSPGSAETVAAHRAHPLASGLHAIEIERQSGGWWAMVDGQQFGSIPIEHSTPAPEFRLSAQGGPAWFSDFSLEELQRPAAP